MSIRRAHLDFCIYRTLSREDDARAFAPLVFLLILAISYVTRPASRRCQGGDRHTDRVNSETLTGMPILVGPQTYPEVAPDASAPNVDWSCVTAYCLPIGRVPIDSIGMLVRRPVTENSPVDFKPDKIHCRVQIQLLPSKTWRTQLKPRCAMCARAFAFTAQKTIYAGKYIAKGDRVFVFASEKGGHGLIAHGVVTSSEAIARKRGVARQTPRVSIGVERTALAKRPMGRRELQQFRDWKDGRPDTELNFKFYRQATNKIVGNIG
jgi:hypothetical protein